MKKRFISLVMAVIMIFGLSAEAIAYEAPADPDTGRPAARELAKQTAEEGMVLMKNNVLGNSGNKALPITQGESVAIFGINQIDFIHGGGGSGNFTSEYYVSLWDGLRQKEDEGKLTLYKDLYAAYKQYFDNSWKTDISYAYGSRQGAVILKYGELALSNDQVNAAAAAADTAIITIGRPAGEDTDRSSGKGDFQLSDKETQLISQVKAKKQAGEFKKIIVVLNVSGVMESTWFAEDDDIDAVLMVYLPGMEGGNAMADVLCGEAYPSGKLVDTWAKRYSDYPSASNFGNRNYTKYEEDIFVGYRYFETIPGAADKVSYEFGYGLSFADLEISNTNIDITGSGRDRTVNVSAVVKNNSTQYSGKEVVQVYYGAPGDKLSQPKKELAAFVKTNELAPGASETVTASFSFDELASYDDVGATGHEAAYVLEAGEYKFYVGNSVKNAAEADSYILSSLEVVEQLQHRMVPDTTQLTRRLKADGTYENLAQTVAAAKTPEEAEARYQNPPESDIPFITFKKVIEQYADDPDILTTFVSRLTSEELIYLVGCTNPTPNRGHRTGIAGIDVYGIPKIGTSNGPAGIQYNDADANNPDKNSTFFPCATMQASTWNVDLIEQVGASMGAEARYFGMSLWQAPGMNIHRDPLCGRNFEYFSEDPLITGKMGSYITKGVQSQKFASQLKHFACNNQEFGRWGNDSQISERALREIYLKGYEITVKESDPWSIMSSYNRINGTYGSANYELLTEVLRYEWGFDGFVMTDFRTTPSHLDELLVGGDLKAPADSPRPAELRNALKSGTLQRWQLERSAERILKFILKTEDAQEVAGKEFKYYVALNVEHDDVSVDGTEILLQDNFTWGEFKEVIDNHYNQTYQLMDSGNNELTDDTVVLRVGMQLLVTAEDGITSAAYTFSNASLALNKPAKASQEENGNPAGNAVDGNMSTRWSAYNADESNKWGHWMEIDLGDAYYITQISTSYYNGSSRTYNYEIWTRTEERNDWSDTAKSRSFASQGYTNAFSGTSNQVSTKNDIPASQLYSRYIAVKGTGGSNGAVSPSINELEIIGWKLESEDYVIDEVKKTISIPFNETTTAAQGKLKVKGDAAIAFGGQSTWIQDGDQITVTDSLGGKTEYTVISTPFLTQPEAVKLLTVGEEQTLSVRITEGASCQWYTNTTASSEGGTPIAGATGTEFQIPAGSAGKYYYYCVADGIATRVSAVEVTNDLALKKPVRASYEEGSNTAPNANDGDDSTRWSSYSSGSRENHWIEFDLGAVYNIDSLTLMPYNGTTRIYEYEVWVKTDIDGEWASKREDNSKGFAMQGYTKAAEGETTAREKYNFTLPDSTGARYIAIRVPGGRNSDGSASSTLTASFYTLNIFGWNLKSDYEVDETTRTITVPAGLSSDQLLAGIRMTGSSDMTLKVENGALLVCDSSSRTRAEYQIVIIAAEKTALNRAIGQTKSLKQADYTAASWTQLQNALTVAQRLANEINAGQEEVDAALKALNHAINTLVAKYTVTFNANSGKVSPESIKVEPGNAIGALPAPVRSGYRFKGWQTADGSTVTAEMKVNANITIYAQWEKISVSPAKGVRFKSGKLWYKVTSPAASAKKNGSVQLMKPVKASYKTLVIPARVKKDGYTFNVESIAKKAFKNNKKLQTVTIRKNVQTIGNEAFSGCKVLKKATLGKGITKIGKKVFYNNKKLKNIKIQSKKLRSAGKNAFKNIHKDAVIKVPSAKLITYKKLLKGKGQKSTVVIK